jgi:hypothetical protein
MWTILTQLTSAIIHLSNLWSSLDAPKDQLWKKNNLDIKDRKIVTTVALDTILGDSTMSSFGRRGLAFLPLEPTGDLLCGKLAKLHRKVFPS